MYLPACPQCGPPGHWTVEGRLILPVFSELRETENGLQQTLHRDTWRPEIRDFQPWGNVFCPQCHKPMPPTPQTNPSAIADLSARGVRDGVLKAPDGLTPIRYDLADPMPERYFGMQEEFHKWYGNKDKQGS